MPTAERYGSTTPDARVSGGWRSSVLGATLVWAATRVLLLVWATVSRLLEWGPERTFDTTRWIPALYSNWDTAYYLEIAERGYADNLLLRAFFPGYPMAGRGVTTVLYGHEPSSEELVVGMFIVTALASLAAAILLWRLVQRSHGDRIALAATTLLLAGPYSFFLIASYSEALFLAFAIGGWLAASRGYWIPAALCAAAASFTRINGAFLAPALALLIALTLHRMARPWISRSLATLGIGLAGLASYLGYLFVLTGSLSAYPDAQAAGWNRQLSWPWETLYQTAGRVVFSTSTANRLQYGLDIVFAAAMVIGIAVLARRRAWPELVYVGLTAVTLMTSFTYLSLARNMLTLFPLVVLVATSLTSHRWRWIYWVVFGVGLGLLLVNSRQFTLGLWAG